MESAYKILQESSQEQDLANDGEVNIGENVAKWLAMEKV